MNILLAFIVVTVPACQKKAAHVPQPLVFASVNSTEMFSCKSHGHPIKSCVWGYNVNGTRQSIIVDQQLIDNGGWTTVDGVSFYGHGDDLEAGKCAISIEPVTENDAWLWSCTLVSQNSTIFRGAVHVGT